MAWKVLVSAPYMLPVIGRFHEFFTRNNIEVMTAKVNERLEESDLLKLVGDIDGVICGDDRFTARVLAAAPRLKVIAKWGTGIDSIDKEAAKKLGIKVCRTPGAFTHPVADSALGYILAFARRQPWMDRHMKQGVWEKIPGRALNECALGVIGVGETGSATLRRAKAFGMRLYGNDIRQIDETIVKETGVEMVSKDHLFASADFISVNCDLNPTSHHLIGEKQLQAMKRSAVLINTARGPVIDEKALVKALQEGWIAGAALDVFEYEPLPNDSPLLGMDNVMLAPHNSNSSPKAWERVHQNTLDMLVSALKDAG